MIDYIYLYTEYTYYNIFDINLYFFLSDYTIS